MSRSSENGYALTGLRLSRSWLKRWPIQLLLFTIFFGSAVSAQNNSRESTSQPQLPSTSGHAPSSSFSSSDSDGDNRANIKTWFQKYDQIRRDAELTLADKLQTKMFLDKNLTQGVPLKRREAALVARMNEKYAAASNAMKGLAPVPETRHLQDGYLDYFQKVHHIFTNYLKNNESNANSQETPKGSSEPMPVATPSLQASKTELEELDRKNKKLDAELRQKYGIPKHKHS